MCLVVLWQGHNQIHINKEGSVFDREPVTRLRCFGPPVAGPQFQNQQSLKTIHERGTAGQAEKRDRKPNFDLQRHHMNVCFVVCSSMC